MRLLPATTANLDAALTVLRSGGIVAHATETCYGLACDLSSPAAVARLFSVKQRPLGQPVSALFPSLEDAKRYVLWNDRAQELADKHLPGPLTLILPLRDDAPRRLHPTPTTYNLQPTTSATLGVRLSPHPVASALAAGFGSPVSTTSANVHGEPNPYSAQAIFERFQHEPAQPDLILDSGTLPEVAPSTVVDLTGDAGTTRRQGGVEIGA